MSKPNTQSPLGDRSFLALMGAQFLGAYNDNLFKMLVSLLAIDAADQAVGSGGYLSLAGAVFIVPYLLFSGYAGFAADRWRKRSVLVATKWLEVAIMAAALVALLVGDVYLLLGVLFLMAAQSTFFSPAKFGVLPEMLPAGQLAQANGYLEMARYIAVIIGSVSAGALLLAFGDRPMMLGGVLVAVAVIGSLMIMAVKPAAETPEPARFRLSPFASVGKGMKLILADRKLRNACAGITYFESLAAFVMMDVLLVGEEVLGLDELGSGMLLAIAGVGIGIGAAIAGRLSAGRINIGLTLPASVGVAASLLTLSLCEHGVWDTALLIGFVGIFGGMFMVPLNAQLQHCAGKTEKGVTICANNFVNMTGALAACGLLWVSTDVLGIAPDDVIMIAGFLAAGVALLQIHCTGGILAALGQVPGLQARLRPARLPASSEG